MNEREQHLLKILVERHIQDGQPVSSKTLADEKIIAQSSATIRNIMARLEEMGYVKSLHTSSGRVPTEQGYRFFVESLLTSDFDDEKLRMELQQELNPFLTTQDLLNSASNLLTRFTRYAGLVSMPLPNTVRLKHVEFLPLSKHEILAILVCNEKDVQNKIIHTSQPFSKAELEQLSNFINTYYLGQTLPQIRQDILSRLQNEQVDFRQILTNFLDSTDINPKNDNQHTSTTDFVLSGEHNLLSSDMNQDFGRLHQLFNAITQKRQILNLLDQCLSTKGVKIFIGKESGYDLFDELSMVSAPYYYKGQIVGALGVIGPVRMPYKQVISIVEVSSKLLSTALAYQQEQSE